MMIDFVEFDQTILNHSWEWLNNPEIKKLTNTPDFTRAQQQQWFDSLPAKKAAYFIKGVCVDGIPIGVTGLKNKTVTEGEYWGYIGDKSYWGKGIGKKMLAYILEQGRQEGLEKIYLKVIASNQRAVALYEGRGFVVVQDASTATELHMEYVY